MLSSSSRPSVVNIGGLLTVNSVIGRSVMPAITAAVDDVNSDKTVLGDTHLNLILHDTNCSGFLGTIEGTRFFRAVTSLFGIMMVQASEEVGDLPTVVQYTPILDEPSSFQPQRKHKPRRKQKMETEVSPTETNTKEHVPTTSHYPLPSGEDRMQLKELMELCTNLSNKVLELENEEESSKQEKKIADIDADAKVNLKNVYNLDMAHEEIVLSMQDVDVQSDRIEDVVKDVVATAENVKAKPKAKRVKMQEPSKFKTTLPSQSSLPSPAKDKGKGLMVELEILLTRKDQIALDKEVARWKYQALKRKHVSSAQARKNMMIYLKNMAGYKMDYFKGMSYVQIRPIFEMEYNKDNAKKQKLEEQEEAEELKKNLKIVPDDEDYVFVNVTPLSSKPTTIIDYKVYKDGKNKLSQIFRANGNHGMYLAFSTMLKNFDREDIEIL
nr:glutamate receptor 3.4-like [Tanacetum cinerariifolium]